jgi:hypothetical protein
LDLSPSWGCNMLGNDCNYRIEYSFICLRICYIVYHL